MDINSLLGPSDTPRSTPATPGNATSTPAQSPGSRPLLVSHTQRPNSGSGKSNVPTALSRSILPPSSIPAHIRSPSQQPSHSSPLISPVPTGTISTPHIPRSSSTQSSMDTLADLASMQNHQPVRSTPPLANRDSYESNRSSRRRPTLSSNPRTSFDIAMVETPREVIRADFSGTSLTSANQQRLGELVMHIQETPSAYDAHIETIKILHQGFVDHIYPSASPTARRDPRSYDLLNDLRQVRETADRLFAVGEDQWLDWLQDESILAQSAEERLDVIEKCRRAVEEEYGSPRLWATYGDWVRHCYDWAADPAADSNADAMPDPERLVGRELFKWDNVLEVWDQAIDQTKHDMAQSHIVWDKFIRTRFPRLEEKMPSEHAKQAMESFQARLQTPHAAWDSSFQTFSSFVSANYSDEDYEEIMAATSQGSVAAKALWNSRESLEAALATALASGDQYAEYHSFAAYLDWEKAEDLKLKSRKTKGKKRNPIDEIVESGMLIHTLYLRAELRVPSVVSIWEEHIHFMIQRRIAGIKDVLARATKHCPWSGSLWKQQLLTSELADEPFDAVEAIKHNATKRGMLDAAGIEEVLKIHDAWCGYLLRRTRRGDAMEEDADVAEMGIRTSIEAVQSLASTLELGANFDASFRLQRKYIEYLKGQGRLDNARKQFDDAIATYGKHYRFWLRFYEFEMQKSLHINSLQQDSSLGVSLNSSAPFAIAILKQGLEYQDLDYPEYLVEALINHCEDYEDADELQSALVLVSRVQKQIAVRRQQEAVVQPAVEAAEAVVEQRTEAVASNLHIGKRKRDDEAGGDVDQHKRVKAEDDVASSVEQSQPTSEELKRDREHASILVRNIPEGLPESRVRQYFSNCGIVQSLKTLQDDDNSYIVEFKEAEEAQYALSRDGQELDGAILSVILNTGSTVYVTNYPPATDEALIRTLFEPYGDIISIRFPSLQGNKRRRFCYVELKAPEQAQAALELDGHEMEGLPMIVKISNPAIRKQRDTAHSPSHVVFVGQLPFKATEAEIKDAFSKFGEIELMRMPRDIQNKDRNKGIAFITYSTAQEAEAALSMNGEKFQERKIKVNMADSDPGRRSGQADGNLKSPTPRPNGDKASPSPSIDFEERRQRTIALADVPDTVNESRIRAVAEKIGPIVKVMLRTNHQGALVEFQHASDAGKASLELNDLEINPGRKIRVTTQKDMMEQKPEKKIERSGRPVPKAPANGPVRRPQQFGARKGGRLGQRSTAVFQAAKGGEVNGKEGAEKKSNDDFRKMLNKS